MHFVGHEKMWPPLKKITKTGIKGCIKPFEEKMHIAWKRPILQFAEQGFYTLRNSFL